MKKLLLLSALLIFACSSDSEGNPCIYEPTLTTQAATDITETSATLNGVISIVSENCDVPNNTEQGFVYSTEIQPTLEDIQINVNGTNILTTIEGLTPNTTYYVRAFLTNNFGDFYGDEVEFTTNEGGSCDGVPYDSIVYGTQEWTVENACHITYRDGTPIPEVTDNTEWESLTTGAWSYYDNDPTKPRLYNWYAVMGIHDSDPNTPNKEFAPEGWHVPTDAEWTTLENYLIANGYNYDGTTSGDRIAKAMASTTGWDSSTNTGAVGNDQSLNNSSGFNALPVGDRNYDGSFHAEGGNAVFWSSTEKIMNVVWHRNLNSGRSSVPTYFSNKSSGFSVRFVRD
ncbi:fibrobacter succinogenes major paralogous domain-containing protein [Polaribacter sp.]|nr:fibrobacter succinogenes major paralogous domain-containing protein [Polaribacter sp.]